MARKILIIGATSAIAQATAKRFVEQGEQLLLIGRNSQRLQDIINDLNIRFDKNYQYITADLNYIKDNEILIKRAIEQLGGLDIVIIAHGTLSDQKACEHSAEETIKEFQTNCLSVISLLIPISNYFEARKTGCIAVFSSVAGDRGRQSNYTYGTAKAAVSTYLQGLRNRLHKSNVQVLTIKPGFVDTPMTKDFKKGLLWAQPDDIAKDILRAIEKKKDILYTPFYWRFIMLVIKFIPETIFKRLKL